jgi:hypothetical protein
MGKSAANVHIAYPKLHRHSLRKIGVHIRSTKVRELPFDKPAVMRSPQFQHRHKPLDLSLKIYFVEKLLKPVRQGITIFKWK